MKMKKNTILTILWITLTGFFASCGEDRTHEYIEKTEVDHWIEAQMQDVYLYYQDMQKPETEYYFYPADEFFPKILASQDKYSYIQMLDEGTKTRNNIQTLTYGFDFILVNDPTQTTTHQMARVLMVLPDSPAEQAGLKRGDFITALNNTFISSSNATKLMYGNSAVLTVSDLKKDPETDNLIWATSKDLNIAAAIEMENNPFYRALVLEYEGKKIGYLMYNEFRMGKDENNTDDQTYTSQMIDIFNNFKAQGVSEFILDLRYNQGGYVTCAQEMASMLAPSSAVGKEFAHFVFNDKRQDLNYTLNLSSNFSAQNLNLNRLFIISGIYTASASEMMINGLRPYMDVYLLGTQTEGKNVAMTRIESEYNFIMYPVTSTVYNQKNESNYANGFTPDYVINELQYIPWYELGDKKELLLYNTLELIAGRTPPNSETTETPEEQVSSKKLSRTVKTGYSSIKQTKFPATILLQ